MPKALIHRIPGSQQSSNFRSVEAALKLAIRTLSCGSMEMSKLLVFVMICVAIILLVSDFHGPSVYSAACGEFLLHSSSSIKLLPGSTRSCIPDECFWLCKRAGYPRGMCDQDECKC